MKRNRARRAVRASSPSSYLCSAAVISSKKHRVAPPISERLAHVEGDAALGTSRTTSSSLTRRPTPPTPSECAEEVSTAAKVAHGTLAAHRHTNLSLHEEYVPFQRGTLRVHYDCNKYATFTHLGKDGSYGIVFRSSQKTGDGLNVIIKVQPLEENVGAEASLRELSVLQHFSRPETQHKNVVPLLDAWECDDALYLVLPMLDCSLHTVLNERPPLPAVHRMSVFSQIVQGLLHIHRHGVVHRDLKPENIAVQRDFSRLFLIDFGASIARADRGTHTVGKYVSTFPYRAPETEKGTFTPAADMWALGCILARMITGKTLFDREHSLVEDREKVEERVKRCVFPHATPYERELLKWLLVLDPNRRVTSAELHDVHHEALQAESAGALYPRLDDPILKGRMYSTRTTPTRNSKTVEAVYDNDAGNSCGASRVGGISSIPERGKEGAAGRPIRRGGVVSPYYYPTPPKCCMFQPKMYVYEEPETIRDAIQATLGEKYGYKS